MFTRLRPPPLRDAARRRVSFWKALTAPQLFVGSFAVLVLLGTLGLKALPGLYTGAPLGWLDALFTATSAVCVTGLIVVDTATYFTPAGQAFILLLIQLGGLGMFAFTTVIIMALGQRLSLRQEALVAGTAAVAPEIRYQRLTRDILVFTFCFEAAGAVLLYACWVPSFGWGGAAWPAVFHSVSAFCNAGFSTFSDNLIGFQRAPHVLLVVMVLIVAGGIGFLTHEELYLWYRARREQEGRRRFSLSIHSRLVLIVTAGLIVAGWVLFTVFEWRSTLGHLPAWARVAGGLFMSVTARTAGFNAVDYGQATDASNFLTVLLMSVGGSPGSTAGGFKTTTIALIGLLAWARLRGHTLIHLWGRTVPEETVQRAVGLFVLAFGVMTAGIFVLAAAEDPSTFHVPIDAPFLGYMFEVASAFNTAGLTMGMTADLSTPGTWTTILLMFVGRVGPLTVGAALARPDLLPARRFRYAYEDVIIG